MIRVRYLNKKENPPNYQAGKELHVIHNNTGWVEYLSDFDIRWATGISPELYEKWAKHCRTHIERYYHTKSTDSFGLIENLSKIRREHDFTLPIFAYVDNNQQLITCGFTRFLANVINGIDPKDLKLFVQTPKTYKSKNFTKAELVTTTTDAEEISGISDVEHIIELSSEAVPKITSSVLRNTVYEHGKAHETTFANRGNYALEFWEKFIKNKLINIQIKCTEQSKKLIHWNPTIWNVEFEIVPEHSFIFGDILAEFRNTTSILHLYVYDITQPLYIDYMLPLTHRHHCWFYTQNKKVHLFNTTNGPSSATWAVVDWPNFVK